MLVTKPANIRYLTGFSGSNATLLLASGSCVLATDGRYRTQARTEVEGIGKHVRLVITRGEDWLRAAVAEALVHGTDGELGVEADHLTLARASRMQAWDPPVRLRPLVGIVETLRESKDAVELALLTRACRITADAFTDLYRWLAPGMTEREVAHRLLGDMIDRGADGAAFDFIVAAGLNGAKPHHRPTRDPISAGELVTIDAGAKVGGYVADMTRTVVLGTPAPRMVEIYTIVAEAQYRGVLACRDDTPAGDVDAVCRGVINDAGHGDHFSHPTGHGVGLDIHEEPILHDGQAARLRAGMAVTVEPGIYLPGLGGVRIEDAVAVTEDNPVPLTTPHGSGHAPKVEAHALIEL